MGSNLESGNMTVNSIKFTGNIQSGGKKALQSCGIIPHESYRKDLGNNIKKLIPTLGFVNKMQSWVGEVPTIIINALGTGLVAPIFIKYNFLSKTDEDTRTYSALRQPISAVLSVLTQCGLIIPYEKTIKNMSNSGEFGNKRYNKVAYQDDSYIEKLIKKSNPNIDAKTLKEKVEARRFEQFQNLVDGVREHNTIRYNNGTQLVEFTKDEFKKLVSSVINDFEKHYGQDIKRYNGEKATNKIIRGEFYRTNGTQASAVLNDILAKATNATSDKDCKKVVNEVVKELKSQKADSELIKIVTEIGKRSDKGNIIGKINHNLSRCAQFASCATAEDVKQIVQQNISTKVNEVNSQLSILEKMRKMLADGASVKDLEKLAKDLDSVDFAHEVVEKYTKNVSGSLKALMQRTGLIVGLAILPLSCWLLNVTYPKIMNALFPELSNSKHLNEKDKFVKSCSGEKSEVHRA